MDCPGSDKSDFMLHGHFHVLPHGLQIIQFISSKVKFYFSAASVIALIIIKNTE